MRRNIFGAFIIAGGLVLLSTASSFAQHGTKPAVATQNTLKAPALVTFEREDTSPTPAPATKAPKAPTQPEVEKPESTATDTEVETPDKAEVETPEVAKPGTGTTQHESETETGTHQD